MAAWTPRTPVSSSWNNRREPAYLLKEDGFRLLLEDWGGILLESSEFVDTQWTPRTVFVDTQWTPRTVPS